MGGPAVRYRRVGWWRAFTERAAVRGTTYWPTVPVWAERGSVTPAAAERRGAVVGLVERDHP